MNEFIAFLENQMTDHLEGGNADGLLVEDIANQWIDTFVELDYVPDYILDLARDHLDDESIGFENLSEWILPLIKDNLKLGIEVEAEHSNIDEIKEEIAKDHLVESPVYYYDLAEMEDNIEGMLEESASHPETETEEVVEEPDEDAFIAFLLGSGETYS